MRRNATIHIQNNTGYDLLLVSSMIEHGNFQHGGKLYLKESPKSADIDEIFSIASVHKCLDVSGAGTENGTNVIIHQSNNGTNQKWKLSDAGEGYFYFEPLNANGMVLDVYENKTQDGSKIAINEKMMVIIKNGKFYPPLLILAYLLSLLKVLPILAWA